MGMPKRTPPIRQKRPQKQQNIRTLFRKYQLWVAIGTIILGAMLGWGLSIISYNFHDGILITLAGVLISVPFFLRAYQLYAHLNIKRIIWLILVLAIIASVAIIITQLQFTQTRPRLTIDFDSSSIITSTGEIKLRIVNDGQSAAYQYYPLMFVAPANQLEKVFKASQLPNPNPLEPNKGEYCLAAINQTTPVRGVWYLYYKSIYSDSPTGGHFYTDDSPYWLSCDFDNSQEGFVDLTPIQKDIFEATIKACYPDEDFK